MPKQIKALLLRLIEVVEDSAEFTHADVVLLGKHINSLEDLTIRNDAMMLIDKLLNEHVSIQHGTAAGALAKVCVMLTMYGSKPDAILAVIHDKGWPVVTLDDVEAVRNYILNK